MSLWLPAGSINLWINTVYLMKIRQVCPKQLKVSQIRPQNRSVLFSTATCQLWQIANFDRFYTIEQELCYKLHARFSWTHSSFEIRRSLIMSEQKYSEEGENTPNMLFLSSHSLHFIVTTRWILSCCRLVEIIKQYYQFYFQPMKRLLSVTPLPSQNGGLDGEMYMKSVVSSEFPTYYRSTGTKERRIS